jgi:hypothetical protein
VQSISLAEGITLPSDVNGIERAEMAQFAQWLVEMSYPTAGGTADALTLTPTTALAAYANNVVYTLTPASSNATTTPTLNISSLGAKVIRKISAGADIAVAAGDLVQGQPARLVYSTAANTGGGAWILINPATVSITTIGNAIQVNASASAPTTTPGSMAVRTNGSFGGGYLMIDGSFYAGMWTASSHYIIGTGTSAGLVSAIDIDGSQNVIGGAIATIAQYRANTTGKLLTTDSTWPAMAVVTLTDAATITWDMSTGIDFQVTLGGNRTLGNPSNTTVGKRGRIKVIQDGTGSRTLTKSSNCKTAGGLAISLTATAAAIDYIDYDCISSTEIRLSVSKGWA